MRHSTQAFSCYVRTVLLLLATFAQAQAPVVTGTGEQPRAIEPRTAFIATSMTSSSERPQMRSLAVAFATQPTSM